MPLGCSEAEETSDQSSSEWDSNSGGDIVLHESAEVRLEGVLNAMFVRRLAHAPKPRPTRRRILSPLGTGRAALPPRRVSSGPTAQARTSAAKRPRASLRELLCESLSTNGSAADITVEELEAIVREIQIALKRMPEDSAEVAHGLVVNLADPLNGELRAAVLSRAIPAAKLVAMDEESLLNPDLRAQREHQRKLRMEQKTADFVEKMNSTITYMYKCTACGGNECFAQFRSADFVKWQGDDPTPTLLRCRKCGHTFRA